MSTVSTSTLENRPPALAKNIFLRFLWKEYRMLRGFWFGVAVLGSLMQWALAQMMFSTDGIPRLMLHVGWGAAALYAIGAAVTLFSAESEERTRDFLLNLPGRWLPMFAAKVTLAVVSAFGLGLVLGVMGGWINGGTWASVADFQNVMAVWGVGVLEATAWGLLFSLWMKQPLLAAVLAIAAASFGAQLAIAATPTAHYSFTLHAYSEAVPLRLFLASAVFMLDVWLGARWYEAAPRRSRRKKTPLESASTTSKTVATDTHAKGSRRKVMARLLWQTWRESWKTMLAAIPIGLFLTASVSVLIHASHGYADLPTPILTLLFLPALFGALVFRADQRGDHRQFLVSHASRPRYVWLARHLFWGTCLLGMTVLVNVTIWAVVALGIGGSTHQILWSVFGVGSPGDFYSGQMLGEPRQLSSRLVVLLSLAMRSLSIGWTAFFTAYALGQFCSLMLRREILAGLLAIIFSVILAAWVAAVVYWQLNPWWFVLPIGVGAMLATWLRMPAWMVARNRPQTWVLPLAAVAVPLVLVSTMLSAARLAQLQPVSGHVQFMKQVQAFEATRAPGQKTADAYFRLHATLEEATDDAARQAVVEQLMELTKQPECRFPELAALQRSPPHKQISELQNLLFQDADRLELEGNLDAALDRYLAISRLQSHWVKGQSSYILSYRRGPIGPQLDRQLIQWATHPKQTSARLRRAVNDLQVYLMRLRVVDVRESILADREKIRAVLLGDEPPSFFDGGYSRLSEYLAYLANELPWERQRALQALDIRTKQVLDYALAAVYGANSHGICDSSVRRRLLGRWHRNQAPMPHRSVYNDRWHAYRRETMNAWQASTSYLVSQEMNRFMNDFLRNTLNAKVRRAGLMTQLALIAYRLDHQRYPESLAELWPKYITLLPHDPYSDNPLEYRPQGFERPTTKQRYLYGSDGSYVTNVTKAEATIPAQTPLLWSVGSGNCAPGERSLTLRQVDLEGVLPDREEKIEVMQLVPTENRNYWHSPTLFTLPKI